MVVNALIAFLDIALDHHALDQLADVVGAGTAVQNFFDDTDLLLELFVGVVVVRVYDAGRILQLSLGVEIAE